MPRFSAFLSRLSFLARLGGRLRVMKGPGGRFLRVFAEHARQLGLLASPSRFVLTIGDEGATLVQFRGRHVLDALFVGPEADDGPGTLRSYLEADPQARVLVAADVLEQMYREETIPKVGRLDRLTIVKRRLDLAFPQDRLKAAVPLDRGKGAGASMLFTALPETPLVAQWVEFLESLPNPIVGFCMLPLESANLAAKLAPSADGESRRVWRALVSQQATSGFRQIFESEGCFVVTRLTPRPPGELTAQGVALLIERELRSSISYMKRLGYSDLDRLDLVVLGTSDVCAAVDARDLPVTSLTALTPSQAADILGFQPVGAEDSPFADVLHAEHLAAKRQPVVTLASEKLRNRLTTEVAFKGGFVAAVALTAFVLFYLGSMAVDAYDALTTAQTLEAQIATERLGLDASRKKIASFPVPIEDVTAVDQTADRLVAGEVNPVGVLRTIGAALDPAVRVQKVSFTVPTAAGAAAQGGAVGRKLGAGLGLPPRKGIEPLYEIHLTVRFSGEAATQPDAATQQAKEVRERLSQALPDHDVSAIRLPFNQLHTQILEGSGTGGATSLGGPTTAEYLIRKRP